MLSFGYGEVHLSSFFRWAFLLSSIPDTTIDSLARIRWLSAMHRRSNEVRRCALPRMQSCMHLGSFFSCAGLPILWLVPVFFALDRNDHVLRCRGIPRISEFCMLPRPGTGGRVLVV